MSDGVTRRMPSVQAANQNPGRATFADPQAQSGHPRVALLPAFWHLVGNVIRIRQARIHIKTLSRLCRYLKDIAAPRAPLRTTLHHPRAVM